MQLLIPKAPFQRLIKEVLRSCGPGEWVFQAFFVSNVLRWEIYEHE
jgi:histone H3/H4